MPQFSSAQMDRLSGFARLSQFAAGRIVETREVPMRNWPTRPPIDYPWLLVSIGMVVTCLALILLWQSPEYQASAIRNAAALVPTQDMSEKERLLLEKDLLLMVASAHSGAPQVFGGFILLIGVYITWRRLEVAREEQITERFTRAIDQLGSTSEMGEPKMEVRLGGIYALERLARDSNKDYWTIMEVLTAYVRANSVRRPKAPKSNGRSSDHEVRPYDVSGALHVLARRDKYLKHGEDQVLSLERADLRRATLTGAHFEGAWLVATDLSGADLRGAHLEGANLTGADLTGAFLIGAKLRGATLSGCILRQSALDDADLDDAYLLDADLSQASLMRCRLRRARLQGAVLREASFVSARLDNANLSSVDASRTMFLGASITGTDFSHADLTGAVFSFGMSPLQSAGPDTKTEEQHCSNVLTIGSTPTLEQGTESVDRTSIVVQSRKNAREALEMD